MATKKSVKKTAKKKSASASGTGDPLVDAALGEAADLGWFNVTLEGIARRAGIPLGQLLLETPTRARIVSRMIDHLDAATVAGVERIDEADTPRDRLFEALMRRFDALNQNRDGMRAVITGIMRDPGGAAFVACRLQRSAAVILGVAGVSADGPFGFIRTQGIGLVAAAGLRAWLNDDTSDLSKTMAAIDRALARAERLVGFLNFRRKSQAEEKAA